MKLEFLGVQSAPSDIVSIGRSDAVQPVNFCSCKNLGHNFFLH